MSIYDPWQWILPAIVGAVTNTIIPVATPFLNQHVVGAGIIQWYYIVASILSITVSILTGAFFTTIPSVWIFLSGLLYGAGTLAIQKATERAPDPGVSIAIPMSRAFLTALLTFIILRIAPNPTSLVGAYGLQAILCGILVAIVHTASSTTTSTTMSTPAITPTTPSQEPQWYVYSIAAAFFLSIADVVLKHSHSTHHIIGNLAWFSLAGAFVSTLFNYKQTSSLFPAFRDQGTISPTTWWSQFGSISLVFLVGVIAQFLAITYATNPAYPTMITSIAIPLSAIVSQWYHHRKTNPIEIAVLTGLTATTFLAGWMTSA
jgi:hypothetical protein